MRSGIVVTVAIATAVLIAAWQAQAAPWTGAAKLEAAAKAATVVETVACNGRWGKCPPASHWWRGACVPC
jgi:hypothetical protein